MLCESCATIGPADPVQVWLDAGQSLLCQHGRLWVTPVSPVGGAPVTDVVIAPGERLQSEHGGEYVVSPLGRRAARVCIAGRPQTRQRPVPWWRWWRRPALRRGAEGVGCGRGCAEAA